MQQLVVLAMHASCRCRRSFSLSERLENEYSRPDRLRKEICGQNYFLEDMTITRMWMQILAVCSLVFSPFACLGQLHVLVDHVGYETHSTKQALGLGTE